MKYRASIWMLLLVCAAKRAVAQDGVLPLAPRTPLEVQIILAAGVIFAAALVFVLWRTRREAKQEAPETSLKIDLHALPVPLAALDADARLLDSNDAWNKLFGLDAASSAAVRMSQLLHPADVEMERKRFAELQNNLSYGYENEVSFYRNQEELIFGRLAITPLSVGRRRAEADNRLSAQRPVAIARVEDLTRTRRAEAGSRAARAALHELYAVVVEDGQALDERLRSMLEMGCRRFNVETGIVGRVRGEYLEIIQVVSPDERVWRGQTHLLAQDGMDATGQNPGAKVSVVAHALAQMRASDGQSYRAATERETYLGAPIRVSGRLHGVLSFASFEARAEPFEASDLEVLQLMAGWLGGEIERSQARRQLEVKSRQLQEQQQSLIEVNARLEELATRDGLTGAYNRRFLDQRLDEEIARARRYNTPLSFLMLDVDKFKQYNDAFGHLAGDEALVTIAKLLQENVRSIDLVARYGGEEFSVILPSTDAAGARILAERLRVAIESAHWSERAVTASLGAATLTDAMKDRSPFTSAADAALYRSKEAGRNRVTHGEDEVEYSGVSC